MTTPASASTPSAPSDTFQPVAMVLAWLFPGAGHVYLGHTRRGLGVMTGVFFLFIFGLFIAGPTAVDSGLFFNNLAKRWVQGPKVAVDSAPEGEPIWFAGTAFVGPIAIGVDYFHQYGLKVTAERTPSGGVVRRSPKPAPEGQPAPAYSRALGRVAEIGILACTLAGMMNLIAIIDAAYNHRAARRREASA